MTISLLKITIWLPFVIVGVQALIGANLSVDDFETVVNVGDEVAFSCTESAYDSIDSNLCVKIPSVEMIKRANYRNTKVAVDDTLMEEFAVRGRFTLTKSNGSTCNEVTYTLTIDTASVWDTGIYRCTITVLGNLVQTRIIVNEPTTTSPTTTTEPTTTPPTTTTGNHVQAFLADAEKEKSVNIGEQVIFFFKEYALEESCVKLPPVELHYNGHLWRSYRSENDELRRVFKRTVHHEIAILRGRTCNEIYYKLTVNSVVMSDAGTYWAEIMPRGQGNVAKRQLIVIDPSNTTPTTTPTTTHTTTPTTVATTAKTDEASTQNECIQLEIHLKDLEISFVQEQTKLVKAQQELIALQILKEKNT